MELYAHNLTLANKEFYYSCQMYEMCNMLCSSLLVCLLGSLVKIIKNCKKCLLKNAMLHIAYHIYYRSGHHYKKIYLDLFLS